MFKPQIEGFSPRDSRYQTGEISPELLARNFGAVLPVAEPLPEIDDIQRDDLPIDSRAPRRAPAPSLLEIATARLTSIKPTSPKRQREVLEWLGRILEPLQAFDEFIATLEEEHFTAIDARWEVIRKAGRALVDSLPSIQAELASAQHYVNQSAEAKVHARADLESAHEERQRISAWATTKEIAAVDAKLLKAREAMKAAAQKAFSDLQTLAAAEGKMATARENLRRHALELKRLAAEVKGEAYFDPDLGLSTDPMVFADPASTKRVTDKLDRHYGVRQ
jgi:hypothetical protein